MNLFDGRAREALAQRLWQRYASDWRLPAWKDMRPDAHEGWRQMASRDLECAVAALDRDELIERLANHFDSQGVPALGMPDLENLARSSLEVLGLIEP